MRVKKRTLVAVSSLVLAICVVGVCSTVYRDYFVAFGWHLRHGNHTIIKGRRVTVPLLWWREDYFGEHMVGVDSSLYRAAPRSPYQLGRSLKWFEYGGSIDWFPMPESKRSATDEAAITAIHHDMEHPTFAEPKYAEVLTQVTLNGPGHPLYCVSETTRGLSPFASLDCRMAGSTVMFDYSGNPDFEKEAEGILSAME